MSAWANPAIPTGTRMKAFLESPAMVALADDLERTPAYRLLDSVDRPGGVQDAPSSHAAPSGGERLTDRCRNSQMPEAKVTGARPPPAKREYDAQSYVHAHVVPAVKGFFESIALSSSKSNRLTLQDILRLLTLWFKYGAHREVDNVMVNGFDKVSIDNWLQVIPQLIASQSK